MSQPPVFISYPRDGANGQALARELHQRLQVENIAAFLDAENILPGDRWIHSLADGAQQCRIMLSVVSPAAHDRPWVEKEFIAANELKALIIPVLADEGNLPFQIKDLQAAKLYGEHKESEWRRVLAQIRRHLPADAADEYRKAEVVYLENLLRDNEERARGDSTNRIGSVRLISAGSHCPTPLFVLNISQAKNNAGNPCSPSRSAES